MIYMKGVILAGGTGSRLYPCTKVTNKHLLPVYDRPMIFYPLMALVKSGIEDIMIITGKEHAGDFAELLGDGDEFKKDLLKLEPTIDKNVKIRLTYRVQSGPNGIADGLRLAKDFVGNDNCIVILGDNIFLDDISKNITNFKGKENGAFIFLKKLPDNELYGIIKGEKRARFGIAEIDNNKIINVVEKPLSKDCKTNLVIIGIYMYTPDVFEKIEKLKPSWRGEYEITDVNEMYIKENNLEYCILDGMWSDAGTIKTLNTASEIIEKSKMT
jgi:glucose-1-phosphate thymidylyltransferase